MTTFHSHYFTYNQTASLCFHGDQQLGFYASDCLRNSQADFRGIHVTKPLRSDWYHWDKECVFVCVVVRNINEKTRNHSCPSWSRQRQSSLYSSSQAGIVPLVKSSVVTAARQRPNMMVEAWYNVTVLIQGS